MNISMEFPAADVPENVLWGAVLNHLRQWYCGPEGLINRAFSYNGYPKPWPDIRPSTKREKIRLGYAPIADQHRTGKLERDAKAATQTYTRTYVEFSIPAAFNHYAAPHQYGSMGTPARRLKVLMANISGARRGQKLPKASQIRVGFQMPPRPPLPMPTVRDCREEGQKILELILKMEGLA